MSTYVLALKRCYLIAVQGNMFVRESARFSSERSTNYGQAFNGFSSRVEKGSICCIFCRILGFR